MSDQGPVDKYTTSDQGLAWEQALCFGGKNSKEKEGKGGDSLFPLPSSPLD